MWIEFSIITFFLAAILYVPGIPLFKAFKLDSIKCLIFAPLYAISMYCVLGIVLSWIGLRANWVLLFFPTLILGIGIYFSSCILKKRKEVQSQKQRLSLTLFIRSDWAIVFLYVGFAIIISFFYYINTLDGSYSYAQDSDNSWHLALIQSFCQSGNMSILDASLYHDLENTGIETLIPTAGSFYPAAWHLLAAMGTQFITVPVSVSANAVNTVFLVLVFPLGMFLLLKTLFCRKRIIQALGAFTSLGFVAFPWGMLLASSGPLFPNFIGFSMVPAVLSSIIILFRGHKNTSYASLLISIIFGIVALGTSHPNAIFTLLVLLIPFLASEVLFRIRTRTSHVIKSSFVAILFVCFSVVLWYFFYNLPLFQSTVSYNWLSFASFRQEIINILFLGYRIPVSQLALSAAVILGIVYLLYRKTNRWVLVSYGICCMFCFIGATTDGWLKSFLTGFWYTDPYRLGAMAALVAIPIATVGLYSFGKTLNVFIGKVICVSDFENMKRLSYLICSCFLISFILVNYYPNFSLNGIANITTPFGYYEAWNINANLQDRPNLYSDDEAEFVEKVSEIVDKDYYIYNCGDDGSPFAYAFNGLNLCYKRSAATLLDGGETEQSELLRNHIDELAYNSDVQQAIKNANIKYILVLDLGGEINDERCYYGYYTPTKWPGINSITDETPGLKCLLSEGDMRLYEIEPIA